MKILYAPGMGRDLKILSEFRGALQKQFGELKIFNLPYDVGEFDPKNIRQIAENDCRWWIGLSLGGSLLYYLTAHCPEEKLPQRLTVINPFSCRKELAVERGFDLAGQWIFSPKEISARVKIFDAIISMNDSSVPIHHGIRLLNLARSEIKNLIFVEANHQITDVQTQLEVADVLIKLHAGDFNFDSSNSCHVYKQCGKISSRAD